MLTLDQVLKGTKVSKLFSGNNLQGRFIDMCEKHIADMDKNNLYPLFAELHPDYWMVLAEFLVNQVGMPAEMVLNYAGDDVAKALNDEVDKLDFACNVTGAPITDFERSTNKYNCPLEVGNWTFGFQVMVDEYSMDQFRYAITHKPHPDYQSYRETEDALEKELTGRSKDLFRRLQKNTFAEAGETRFGTRIEGHALNKEDFKDVVQLVNNIKSI